MTPTTALRLASQLRFSSSLFRNYPGMFATGVTIVTARAASGEVKRYAHCTGAAPRLFHGGRFYTEHPL